MSNLSALHRARLAYVPKIPAVLAAPAQSVRAVPAGARAAGSEMAHFFPATSGQPVLRLEAGTADANPGAAKKRRVGVLLSGGQAPGGHNVIAGLFDALTEANAESELIGFFLGPSGLVDGEHTLLTRQAIDSVRNTGGFDLIGSGRTKIDTERQLEKTIQTVRHLRLDAVVIVGGDDSNTNAAVLAEQFRQRGVGTQVIGIPKTIDGDLKNEYIETSFGFDTATKVYSQLIESIARDTMSSKKYWNFIKLMGRSASHIALECALQVHPNVCLIGEEIAAAGTSLANIIEGICGTIAARAAHGENFGIVLIPEGIVEFIPETAHLIAELNRCWQDYEAAEASFGTAAARDEWLGAHLSARAFQTFRTLPAEIAAQFLGLRDPHGNLIVSRIDTEKLFIGMTAARLSAMKAAGAYRGTFSPMSQFFGYEGRSEFPSNFDADYCYALGRTAFLLIAGGATGYIASVGNLARPRAEWTAGGVPLTTMMTVELRRGAEKPVIAKSLVDLQGAPFRAFAAARAQWAVETDYVFPGPLQYFGPPELCDAITRTLALESAARAGERDARKTV